MKNDVPKSPALLDERSKQLRRQIVRVPVRFSDGDRWRQHEQERHEAEERRDTAERREALLAEAGHPNGITAEIAAKKDPAWEIQAVQAMVSQWKEAGINVNINLLPSAQFWDVWDKFPMGFVAWGHRPLGFMVLSLGFRSGVPWNPTGFADKEFDGLLDKAEATLDLDERRKVKIGRAHV